MQVIRYPSRKEWPQILRRPVISVKSLESTVESILSDIQTDGEQAVKKYTLQFDKATVEDLAVDENDIASAGNQLSSELKEAIRQAAVNIETFHATQKISVSKTETMEGVSCWRKPVAIEKVGLYIPGGSAPLFSTVLMLGIPAKLAGCKEIILCSPPSTDGKLHPAILFAAALAGITKIFKVGGEVGS